ncbi:unnamed protein product [Withania somnifera]
MEASTKLVAMFLLCIIVFSSPVHFSMADGEKKLEKIKEATEFTICYNICHKLCSDAGFGYTHCEMKCDEDCTTDLLKEKIDKFMKN